MNKTDWAMKHPDKLGAGAKKRTDLPCDAKFGVVMKEFERGTLYSGSGQKVTDIRQAKAIGVSETKRCKNR